MSQRTPELDPLLVGKNVEGTCQVESVKVIDPQDQILVMRNTKTNQEFTLTEYVPYDATPGWYHATVIAQNSEGEVVRQNLDFEIKY